MGTVGLSFGSPTSGAGFNVSSTVAEIVSNLQNVETPWKNQLTSLESQDTVISNLGSLLSNVSTDIGNLTDFQGILAQKTGSSSDTNVLQLTSATSSAVAGTHTVAVNSLAQTSSGYLAEVAGSSDTLSGSVTLQVGSGTAQTIALNSSDDTLAGLAAAINASGVGITASVLTDASGSRLSLVSGTSGAGGNITVSANSITAAASNTLGATVTAGSGATASTATLSAVVNSSETLTGSLAVTVGSGTQQQISMSAVSAAEGGATLADLQQYIAANTATLGFTAAVVSNSDGTASLQLTSGTAGTLSVSSSLTDSSTSLAYAATVNGANASLSVDGVSLTSASNTVSNLIPGITFQLLGTSAAGSPVQVVIANDNSGVESVVNQFVSDYNSLVSAVNTQEGNTSSGTPEPLFGSPTLTLLQQELLSGINAESPNGSLSPVAANAGVTLSGSMTIQAGSGSQYTFAIGAGASSGTTFYTGSGNDTLADLASAINAADIGVTAGINTGGGDSTLTLTSQTAGASGALTVTSAIAASTPTALGYTDSGYTSATADSGLLGSAASASDALSGSISIQTGGASPQTIAMSTVSAAEGGATLADLQQYIAANAATLGCTAAVVSNSDGTTSLQLTANTAGAAGALSVSSSLYDTTSAASSTLNYGNMSDINNLTSLGISVNSDGTLAFDAGSLDSVLNTDYSSVASFFQNASGWGQSFAQTLSNAGSGSSSGMLALAASANSTIESTLNAEISKEQTYISTQQSSLTNELNQANQILQQLPTQLQGMNELYSAITGYNQTSNG